MKSHNISILVMICILCMCGQSYLGLSVTFVVPADSTNQDANSFSYPPFYATTTFRYQQVCAASEFSSLTNFGGGWLTDILFRGDATNGTSFGVQIPNIQVNFSTTSRGPDELSTTFADNVGADDTTVFAGYLHTDAIGGHRPGPEPFSFWIHLSKLFFYDPTVGNLLMDIKIFQGDTNTIMGYEPILDAWNRTNDAVSRVVGET